MLGKWPSPAKLPETRALKGSALDQARDRWMNSEGILASPDRESGEGRDGAKP